MITIQLVSEDFSAQELMEHLEQEGALHDLNAIVVPVKKEGLSNLQDFFQIQYSDPLTQKLALEAMKLAVVYALKKAHDYAFPDPHILIRYKNGREKKIPYEGKSDATIVKELLAEINDGEVLQVFFKS